MPNWTSSELAAHRQREALRKRNVNENRDLPSITKPEQIVRNVAVGQAPRKETNATGCKRRRVCVVSYRARLIDPDNLCPKYFLDALRYCGVLADDSDKHITLEMRQEKSDNPRTEITIE